MECFFSNIIIGMMLFALFVPAGCAVQQSAAPLEQRVPAAVQPGDEMLLIPGGRFTMGSIDGEPDEKPPHAVEIAPFYMDVHEVTNGEFKKFADATGHPLPPFWYPELDRADEPVSGPSWHDAQAYARWAGKRLPTEAEWEYAARGGQQKGKFPWSGRLDAAYANFSSFGILPVKRLKPNGFGLYDMIGNVWEWCADWYADDFYGSRPVKNPTGPSDGTLKVLRGGAWYCEEAEARTTNRFYAAPDARNFSYGFRCVRDVK